MNVNILIPSQNGMFVAECWESSCTQKINWALEVRPEYMTHIRTQGTVHDTGGIA